jgi:putative transcriptional regulator
LSIEVRLNVMMAEKRIRLNELARRVGLSEVNLSVLKNHKARAIRFSTLEALCRELECQPGDLLRYVQDEDDESEGGD